MPNWSRSMLAGTFLIRPSGDMKIPFFADWLLGLFVLAAKFVFDDGLFAFTFSPDVDKFVFDKLFDWFCVRFVSLEF